MKRLICIATLLAWSGALAADGYLAISNNVMVTGPGGSGSNPNALTNNDSRAVTLTNSANVFAGESFTVATQYVGTVVLTNVDGSFWTNLTSTNINNSGGSAGQVLTATATGVGWSNSAAGNAPTFNANQFSSDASGTNIPAGATFTNILLTGSTNYGSAARTNWTWMDAAGWHNTNNSAASQGVDISRGNVSVAGQFNGNGAGLTNTYSISGGYTAAFSWSTTARYCYPFTYGNNSSTEASVALTNGPVPLIITNLMLRSDTSIGVGTNLQVAIMTNGVAGSTLINFTSPGSVNQTSSGNASAYIPENASVSFRFLGTNPTNFAGAMWWQIGIILSK